jgi:hypothetical protein
MSGSRAAGVCWIDRHKRWRAASRVDAGDGKSKVKHLGWFLEKEEVRAALAYDEAAREHHGDKAQLNFPHLPPPPQMASSEQVRPMQGTRLAWFIALPQIACV